MASESGPPLEPAIDGESTNGASNHESRFPKNTYIEFGLFRSVNRCLSEKNSWFLAHGALYSARNIGLGLLQF